MAKRIVICIMLGVGTVAVWFVRLYQADGPAASPGHEPPLSRHTKTPAARSETGGSRSVVTAEPRSLMSDVRSHPIGC